MTRPTPPTDPRARRLFESARRLARTRAERDQWAALLALLTAIRAGMMRK
jgi:hypothetical protein